MVEYKSEEGWTIGSNEELEKSVRGKDTVKYLGAQRMN
jgi:hypothetical protein